MDDHKVKRKGKQTNKRKKTNKQTIISNPYYYLSRVSSLELGQLFVLDHESSWKWIYLCVCVYVA